MICLKSQGFQDRLACIEKMFDGFSGIVLFFNNYPTIKCAQTILQCTTVATCNF